MDPYFMLDTSILMKIRGMLSMIYMLPSQIFNVLMFDIIIKIDIAIIMI